METGYSEGLFPKALDIVKTLYPRIPSVNILPWIVYTKKDTQLYSSKNTNKTGKMTCLFGVEGAFASSGGT